MRCHPCFFTLMVFAVIFKNVRTGHRSVIFISDFGYLFNIWTPPSIVKNDWSVSRENSYWIGCWLLRGGRETDNSWDVKVGRRRRCESGRCPPHTAVAFGIRQRLRRGGPPYTNSSCNIQSSSSLQAVIQSVTQPCTINALQLLSGLRQSRGIERRLFIIYS
jgi:hypothetical protein